MSFMASSMVSGASVTFSLSTTITKPVMGLGAVGRKMQVTALFVSLSK